MAFFDSLMVAIVTIGAMFLLYRSVKHNRSLFTKQNISNSLFTMGILALLLIAVIAVVVLLLRGGHSG